MRLLPDWSHAKEGSWTTDGQYLIFWGSRDGREGLWAVRERSGFLRRRQPPEPLNTGSTELRVPRMARTGRRAYAVGTIPQSEMYRFDVKTRRMLPLVPGMALAEADISPDGEWIADCRLDGGLWRFRKDGTESLQLVPAGALAKINAGHPKWSPDGTRIAFSYETENAGGASDVYVVSRDGGKLERITSAAHLEIFPQWFPDGKSLLFTQRHGPIETTEIQIIDLETRKVTTVPGSQGVGSAFLSPDGKYIAGIRKQEILRYDWQTQQWVHLAPVGAGPSDLFEIVAWSIDSRFVFFVPRDEAVLRKATLATGKVETVADLAGLGLRFFGLLGTAPDGSLLFSQELSSSQIYAFDLELP